MFKRGARHLLAALLGIFFGRRKRPPTKPESWKRILVIRIDQRMGNAVMLEPWLHQLERSAPHAHVELLLSPMGARIAQFFGFKGTIHVYKRRQLHGPESIFAMIGKLRRQKYDAIFDVTNPTDPSVTQALLTRLLSGSSEVIGFDQFPSSAFYTHPVQVPSPADHEAKRWMALLHSPNLEHPQSQSPRYYPQGPSIKTDSLDLAVQRPESFNILNVGARLQRKQLHPHQYIQILSELTSTSQRPWWVTWGPSERGLAQAVVDAVTAMPTQLNIQMAPPTSIKELYALFGAANLIVTCDTGPMHLAVASARPTAQIFVSTEPQRYGYSHSPHCIIDAREGLGAPGLNQLSQWVRTHESSHA